MIGLIYKKKRFNDIKCTCPNCKNLVMIPKERTVLTQYGYDIVPLYSCECGYSTNLIIINIHKLDERETLKKTCKNCGQSWQFNSRDVSSGDTERMTKAFFGLAGSPISLLPNRTGDYNRCDKCGSRKVTVEIIKFQENYNNQPRENSNLASIINKIAEIINKLGGDNSNGKNK